MKISNYQESVEALYSHLEDYLQQHGLDTRKNFRCISPTHDDSNPSMGLAPSKKAFHCFGCGVSGGIFHAAHFLEGKAITGQAFVTENLSYLAEKFEVELKHEPLSDEEIYELDTYRAYRVAAELIVSGVRTESFNQAIAERGWSRSDCDLFGTGCVADYRAFRESLKSAGFSASFLDDIDLGRKDIFGPDRLIFTIRDDSGRPVGFASRNLKYTEDKQNGAKYVNQKCTGIKCNIYRKSARLYGLDHLLQNKAKGPAPVYLFEGYADRNTAAAAGIWHSVAIGGTSLSPEQVFLLKKHNIYNVVLCLDPDEPGQERLEAMLDNVLAGHKDLQVSIVVIPGGMDPDEFIREKGPTAFNSLKKWSAFEWRLSRFAEDTEAEIICDSMIPLIVNEPSYVAQEKMCKSLAEFTGVTLKSVLAELHRIQNANEAERVRHRDTILDNMVSRIKRNPDEAVTLLQETQAGLYELSRRYDEDNLSEESALADLDSQKTWQEEKDGSFSGFILGSDLYNIQKALDGDWKRDVWFPIGGKPNSGKTSLVTKMAYEIARHPENNACVIVLSIDDSLKELIPKYVCVAEGSRRLNINHVQDPNYHARNTSNAEKLFERRETGYSIIRSLTREGRLILKDANHGSSIAYIDRLLRFYRERFPDRNMVFVLDNFHKLRDYQSAKGDERSRFKEISTVIKNMAVMHHCCIISTIEYRKIDAGKKATNADIIETGQIEYDANIIAHVHNELHELKERANLVHFGDDPENAERMPTIEVDISKNKISAFKGSMWFDFYPYCSDFVGVDSQKVADKVAASENSGSSFVGSSPFAN